MDQSHKITVIESVCRLCPRKAAQRSAEYAASSTTFRVAPICDHDFRTAVLAVGFEYTMDCAPVGISRFVALFSCPPKCEHSTT